MLDKHWLKSLNSAPNSIKTQYTFMACVVTITARFSELFRKIR